ncbi:SDR family oxidoreductase [uncultured Litoreibacter sp.]|uniref:SDR family oxidoreductase n=1 Tax=uncultured Litoreibacter sp. TaxID=1392394 RepID=UPI00260295DA|nr:SDR family oxidoreductase [uncultured Litoreibacter sp.]
MIISAGANGIGLAIARHFAANGASVAICDVDEEAIAAVAAEFDLATVCDVTDADVMDNFVKNAVSRLSGVTTVIANAGTAGPTSNLEDIDPDDWSRTIAVNLTGQYTLLKSTIPHLKAQGAGAVILMSSAAGRLGLPMRSPYAAAKWGVIGLKETLAMELGPHGISVNAILPGSVTGPRMDAVLTAKAKATNISLEEARLAEVANASMCRMIDPQEIAELAWFLASPAARSVSGQSVGLCGNFETLR